MDDIFAQRVKQGRLDAHMTQAELAKESGLSCASISAYEKGGKTPSVSIAAAIARALRVSLDWLVGLDDNKSPRPRTAEDCAQIMLDAIGTWEIQGLIDRIEIDGSAQEWLTLKLSDGLLLDFIQDWAKVHEMYTEKVIDQEMYEAWIEKRFRELRKAPASELRLDLPF